MYQAILEELRANADEEYKTFHSRLLPTLEDNTLLLGVRVPILRKMAGRIAKDESLWRQFVSQSAESGIYEMDMLRGMVIAMAKCSLEERTELIKAFVPTINNWAVCDIFCSCLKSAKKHPREMYALGESYLTSPYEYRVRFGAVMLMDYFIDDEHIDRVLCLYGKINHSGYYAKMAVAWGLSLCFVKYRDKTLAFLADTHCPLDSFTYNKAIQKIRESYRVDKTDKALVKKLVRK